VLPKEYESEARVLVGSLTETDVDQLGAYQQLAQTYAELATTTPVLARVVDELGLNGDLRALAERIDVRAPTEQPIVRVLARGPSPVAAQQLANSLAGEIIELAKPTEEGASGLGTIVQPAILPDNPSSPRPLVNAVISAGLALMLAVATVLVISRDTGRRSAS
jgi:succinoglycan biosynthesis transport protein ExoP